MFWQSWLIQVAIGFIMRQLAKWKTSINWDLVKKDIELRVRQIVPGKLFDDEAVSAVNRLVDIIRAALAETKDLQTLLTLLAQEKWQEAAELIKRLVLKTATASTAVDKALVAMISQIGEPAAAPVAVASVTPPQAENAPLEGSPAPLDTETA